MRLVFRRCRPRCFALFRTVLLETRGYFYCSPGGCVAPFLPPGRTDAHIDEIEFLAEVVCAVIWVGDVANLVLFGITDNSRANMRIAKGHAKKGAGLRLARAFRHWVIRSQFRYISPYCRSERNSPSGFLPRASVGEITDWADRNGLTRVLEFPKWGEFRNLHSKLRRVP